MKVILTNAILFAALATTAVATPAQAAEDQLRPAESGRWITESGNFEVDIAPCGQVLCGTVVRVLANRSMSRPSATMQAVDNRSPLGMKLLSELTPSGNGEWKGQIYNRENGETYNCLVQLLAPDQLKVRAYKGSPLFGKTQVWHRVTGDAQ